MGWDSITPTKPAELCEFAIEAVQNPVQLPPEAVQDAVPPRALDADLSRLVSMWPTLSPATRRKIVGLLPR